MIQPRDDKSQGREERGGERSDTSACVFLALRRSKGGRRLLRRGGAAPGGLEKGCLRVPPPNGSAPRVGATVAAPSPGAAHVVVGPHRAGAEARRHKAVTTCGDRTAWSTCQVGPHASCEGLLLAWWWARGALVISSSSTGPPVPRSDSLDALDRREKGGAGRKEKDSLSYRTRRKAC